MAHAIKIYDNKRGHNGGSKSSHVFIVVAIANVIIKAIQTPHKHYSYPLSTPPSRAPRWAGSTSDEYITYFMASSKPSKRPYPDSDSDSEPLPSTFPHFIVLESLDEKQLTKLNPIIIEKTISGIVNPISVKKLNNGTLLIEVDKKAYAENLLKMKTFASLKIKASPHLSQFF